MQDAGKSRELVELDVGQPIWDRFFWVAPLVLIGTREPDGGHDLAPKHMVTPLGWQNYFGFVCTPRHGTYGNAQRTGVFTVTYPRPEQLVTTSLAASPRQGRGKPALSVLPVFPAATVDGVLVEGGYLFLECELDRIVDGFGENALIVGRVVAARAEEAVLRGNDRADEQIMRDAPVLAYLNPGRFASVRDTLSFPFPSGMRK